MKPRCEMGDRWGTVFVGLVVFELCVGESEALCDQLGAVGDEESVFEVDVVFVERLHFLEHSFDVDHAAVADDIGDAVVEDS